MEERKPQRDKDTKVFLFLCALCAFVVLIPLVPSGAAQKLQSEPAGTIKPATSVLLSIDDGIASEGLGGSGDPGFGWVNLLKPDTYPATLQEVQVAFNNSQRGMSKGSPIRIVVYIDPEADGPNRGQRPDLFFSVTSNNPGSYERYTLPQTLTINSGAFVVGALDSIFVAELPALIDVPGTILPAGSRSFFTVDNAQTYSRVDQTFPGFGLSPGSWLVRAVVDVTAPQPVITRAFYKNSKLKIAGRNFSANAIVRINGKRISDKISFNNDNGKLTVKGSTADLNINPSGQSNKLVVIVDGVASEIFEFTT
jgi:hypothetical protein